MVFSNELYITPLFIRKISCVYPENLYGNRIKINGILCGYFYFVKLLNLENGIPSHDTFFYVFRSIDSKKFIELFINWIKEIIKQKGTHLAIDGKAIKSARDKIMVVIHCICFLM